MSGRVVLGDAVAAMREMASGSVDAVITDPPYGMDYQSHARRRDARFSKIANDRSPFIWWLGESHRVAKDGGALICFTNWRNAETWRVAVEAAGWRIRSQVIWDRERHGMGCLTAEFGPRHDVIWFGTKGRYRFPGQRPQSVLRYPRVPGDRLLHPTQKPVALMESLCRSVCAPGGLVLDPFCGSGATGEGAIAAGREFVGVELDPTYAALARTRIAAAIAASGASLVTT